MTEIDLLKRCEKAIDFEPIAIPQDAEIDTLRDMLSGAESALFSYKKMLEGVKAADAVTDAVKIGTWEFDFMTENCTVPAYEDCAIDVVSTLKKHLTVQVDRFTQLCSDLEAEIEDAEQQEADDRTYGTYDEQVRSYFYSTR